MQPRQNQEQKRHGRVDRLPQAKRVFLRRHLMHVHLDIIGGQALVTELSASVVQRP